MSLNSTYKVLGKYQENDFVQDKRQRLLWWSVRNDRLQTPSVCGVHTYGGRCYFITILNKMNSIKNEVVKVQPEVFTFNSSDQPMRGFCIDGEPYFVAKDICDILDLSNPSMTIQSLDEDERAKYCLGRQGETWCVNESGLYHLIFQSRKPEAKAFRRKVTMEILPTLRRTGRYEVKPQPKSVRYARRGEGITVEVLSLLWLIGESLHQGDQKDIALELGVDRRTVSRVLSGKQRSSRVLRALYERARWNRENDALYLQPGVMAERLQQGLPMEAVRPLPVHKSEELPMVSIHRGGKLGNQNARKYGRTMKEIRNLARK